MTFFRRYLARDLLRAADNESSQRLFVPFTTRKAIGDRMLSVPTD
jgi:hypothetical protein